MNEPPKKPLSPARLNLSRGRMPWRVLFAVLLGLSSLARADQDSPPLRVMSFNIRYGAANDGQNAWDNRREGVKQAIARFHPDLLSAQEVLDFQAKALQEMLPGYGFVGVGRADGRTEGEFSLHEWVVREINPRKSGSRLLTTLGVSGILMRTGLLPRPV